MVYEGEQVSYGELNRRANQLAHYLREQGVGPESVVGMCVERSVEMVVGVLAMLKAGGAYVPLDPAYPAERLAYMLADARPTVVLTQRDWWGVRRVSEVRAGGAGSRTGRRSGTRAGSEPGGETTAAANLAYVIYTSGSTGRPKGVMVSTGT